MPCLERRWGGEGGSIQSSRYICVSAPPCEVRVCGPVLSPHSLVLSLRSTTVGDTTGSWIAEQSGPTPTLTVTASYLQISERFPCKFLGNIAKFAQMRIYSNGNKFLQFNLHIIWAWWRGGEEEIFRILNRIQCQCQSRAQGRTSHILHSK